MEPLLFSLQGLRKGHSSLSSQVPGQSCIAGCLLSVPHGRDDSWTSSRLDHQSSMLCVDYDVRSRSSGYVTNSRIPGVDFDAVYYADDTILFSTSPRGLNELLKHMEECSGHYGLKLTVPNAIP